MRSTKFYSFYSGGSIVSNIGYDRKPGETTEDRMVQTLSALEPVQKERYEDWLRGYLQEHSLDETIFIDQPFPVGNEETGGFFTVKEGRLPYVQSDCSIKLYIIVPKLVYHAMRRDDCSVFFFEKDFTIIGDELPPLFNDMEL